MILGIRAYMYDHYGVGYMPYFFYGTHMGFGYPPYGIGYLPFYHPYYHQLDHYLIHLMDHPKKQPQNHQLAAPYFAVPLGGSTL